MYTTLIITMLDVQNEYEHIYISHKPAGSMSQSMSTAQSCVIICTVSIPRSFYHK